MRMQTRNLHNRPFALERPIAPILLGVFLTVLLPAICLGQAGTLDPTFGDGGLVTTDFLGPGGNDFGYDVMAIQADGKIVVAGESNNDFALARYNTDGSLDASFGTGGQVTTDFDFGSTDEAWSVAIQADGKIVAAGRAVDPGSGTGGDFALARYNADGSLDASFGTGGTVITDITGVEDYAYSVAIQANGKIVAAGRASGAFGLARYNIDGSLDATFGIGGIVTTNFFVGYLDQAFSVALQADGKIVAAGQALVDIGLARYNADGSLDASFGTGGTVITDITGVEDYAYSVAIQANGKIVAAGRASGAFGLARYNIDGSLDTSFDADGIVTTNFFNGVIDQAFSVALQADGKIVAAGQAHQDIGLARYNADGSLDASFGTGGTVITDFAGGADEAWSVALQADGKIVAAGRARMNSTGNDFALARYNADGTLDTSFGTGGLVTTDFLRPGGNDFGYDVVAVQADGKIVVAGESNNDFALARYNADGSLDPTFGTGGTVTTDFAGSGDWAWSVAVQADGKIVAAGRAVDPGSGTGGDFALVRYNADGSLDPTFGTGGTVTTDFAGSNDVARSVAVQADGKIVAAGWTWISGAGYDFVLARYLGTVNPQLALEALIEDVQQRVTDGSLNNGQGNALLVKLQGAIHQLDKDNKSTAVNKLEAFINEVEAFVQGGVLTAAEGQPLLDDAQAIIDQLNPSSRTAEAGPQLAATEMQVGGLPETYALSQNYPNPFNPSTEIRFDLPEAVAVRLMVYDVRGREVARLVDGILAAGQHRVAWDARQAPSGVYVYRLTAGSFTETRRMVLLR